MLTWEEGIFALNFVLSVAIGVVLLFHCRVGETA